MGIADADLADLTDFFYPFNPYHPRHIQLFFEKPSSKIQFLPRVRLFWFSDAEMEILDAGLADSVDFYIWLIPAYKRLNTTQKNAGENFTGVFSFSQTDYFLFKINQFVV